MISFYSLINQEANLHRLYEVFFKAIKSEKKIYVGRGLFQLTNPVESATLSASLRKL